MWIQNMVQLVAENSMEILGYMVPSNWREKEQLTMNEST